ncbi:MAG: T9SS type A sorting domain-containing protein [Bacteroidetes bacterium]|nr:T9SS type A sorting domain-containing protein [Bacteroidota bacterium]
MKKIILLLLLLFSLHAQAQVVNQITILPANPTSTDTLYVVTDFSYFGNCSFSLVGYYYYIQDSTIHVLPTYCGYGDSTLCTSIDTLKLETYPANNYVINIEFHQGSVCPFSHFDATIAQFDTTLTISTPSGIDPINASDGEINVFPNPAIEELNVQIKNQDIEFIELYNSLGEFIEKYGSSSFSVSNLSSGIYWIRIYSKDTFYSRKIIKK